MKKFKISTVAAIAVYTMLAAVLTSCSEEDACNFNGCQIVEKADAPVGMWFRLRKDGKITDRIYVVKYDWDRYNLGDTLYCR